MIESIVTSFLAFASTNIDDLFILMLFFGSRRFRDSTVFAGQYLGIGVLVLASFIGSYIENFVDQRYIGLLGVFPIYLAIKHIIDFVRRKGQHSTDVVVKSSGVLAIAGVTIANGGDNIGVYIPLLTTMSQSAKIQMIGTFLVMTYLWCMIAKYLSSHSLIATQLDKFAHVIMPIVLFLLGIFILLESGTFGLIRG